MRKAIIASIREVDPCNPWIKDASGRHTNVMAVLDWPGYDSDESDSEVSQATIKAVGNVPRHSCLTCLLSLPKGSGDIVDAMILHPCCHATLLHRSLGLNNVAVSD